MTDHDGDSRRDGLTDPSGGDHRAAHERLATGSLARWARMCATHPWRVVAAWIGIIAVLIVLVGDRSAASLRDEFEIPGSDTQKATDLIESEFASEQGAVLNLVFAAPQGERLDTPDRKAAIEKAVALLKTPEFKPRPARPGSRASATRSAGHVRRRTAGSPTPRRSSTRRSRTRTATRSSPSRTPSAARPPAGVTVEYNGEAEFPPIEQGTSEPLGLLAAIIVLLVVFRTFTAMLIPIALASARW